QLDGGHILYALIGPYHRVVSLVLATILIVLGFFSWPGWSLWGTLVLIIGIKHAPIKDQHVPLDLRRRVVSFASLIVFVLTFMPSPFYIITI
ncbi:MAG: site-2 protease family protein, partial [Deltaproteobacteria bacterium]|nr:site-2 protease family protein [Deltaproteobacteria bacterium]